MEFKFLQNWILGLPNFPFVHIFQATFSQFLLESNSFQQLLHKDPSEGQTRFFRPSLRSSQIFALSNSQTSKFFHHLARHSSLFFDFEHDHDGLDDTYAAAPRSKSRALSSRSILHPLPTRASLHSTTQNRYHLWFWPLEFIQCSRQ